MIENPELALSLLHHFARTDMPYPSNLKPADLYVAFPNQDPADIDYSFICAIQSRLLDSDILGAAHSTVATLLFRTWMACHKPKGNT